MSCVVDLLIDLLGVLASYSITVNELRTLFSLLRVSGNKWVRSIVTHCPHHQHQQCLSIEIIVYTFSMDTVAIAIEVNW